VIGEQPTVALYHIALQQHGTQLLEHHLLQARQALQQRQMAAALFEELGARRHCSSQGCAPL
jgi:hypothetical protein